MNLRSAGKHLRWQCLLAVIVMSAASAFAQPARTRSRTSSGEKLITALINSEQVRGAFADDGMYTFANAPEIEDIFALGDKAIPLLIAHLDDKRLLQVETRFLTIDNNEPQYVVTVGAASLDLLTYIIKTDARFFDRSCIRDMEEGHVSSCLKSSYAIAPEDFWSGRKKVRDGVWYGKHLRVTKSIRRAKRNWQIAFRKHQIRYTKFSG